MSGVVPALLSPGDLPDLSTVLRRPAWHAGAACRGAGPDLFVPPTGVSAAAARAVCDGCRVRPECLAYALDDASLQGVWGGTSGRERVRLRRARP